MPWYWADSTMPTWTSSQTATTSAWSLQTGTTSATTSTPSLWVQFLGSRGAMAYTQSTWQTNELRQMQAQVYQQQAMLSAYHEHERYELSRGLGQLWAPASPGLITHQDQARRDEQLYRRAVAEHDEQEAARLLRIVEQHARTAEERQWLIDQQRTAHAEEQQRRVAASDRAQLLLRENLTPQQLETFDRNGWFVVEGGRTKQKYRIRSGTMVANVDVIDKDQRTMHRLCGHVPVDRVPHGDQLLAQKIMIELAEDDFLRVANRHG